MHRKKSTMIKIISLLFSFLITASLFSSSILIVLHNTVFNYKFAVKILNVSDYYTTISKEIENEFVSLGSASGFDSSIFEDIIPKKTLENDVNKYVLDVYSNTAPKVDTSELVASLDTTFMNYANAKGITVTDESKQAIHTLEKKCAAVYSNHISFMFAEQVSTYLYKLNKVCTIMLSVLTVFTLVLGSVLFLINKWKHIAIRNCIYSISACILMLLPIPIAGFASHKIEKVGITAKSMYDFAVSYANNVLYHFIYIILLCLIILSVCIFLYVQRRNAVTKKKHESNNDDSNA